MICVGEFLLTLEKLPAKCCRQIWWLIIMSVSFKWYFLRFPFAKKMQIWVLFPESFHQHELSKGRQFSISQVILRLTGFMNHAHNLPPWPLHCNSGTQMRTQNFSHQKKTASELLGSKWVIMPPLLVRQTFCLEINKAYFTFSADPFFPN